MKKGDKVYCKSQPDNHAVVLEVGDHNSHVNFGTEANPVTRWIENRFLLPVTVKSYDGEQDVDIRAYQQSLKMWPMNYNAHLDDQGKAGLVGACYWINDCGCQIIGSGTLQFPLSIRFCKKHAVTDRMVNMLSLVVEREKRAYYQRCDQASVHNNADGVGVDFDYVTPEPLPEWVKEIEKALKIISDESK